jgi:glycine dehydrogenase subunit 1
MFIPHTDNERDEMLRSIGVKNLEDLFDAVPTTYRFPKLNIPAALTEMEVLTHLKELSEANESTRDLICFLGAGAYNHYIPSAVDSILRRGEFFTAYTPYQPEISQGTLQAVFEYQSLIANLTGLDVSNASHYDGATAAAEAAVLAYHHFRGKRKRIVISPAVNPQFRDVVRTYMDGYENLEIIGDEADRDPCDYLAYLDELVDQTTSLVIVQYPDFLGRIYDFTAFAEKVHSAGALLAVIINPTTLGLLKSPGEMGADIAVGEGQPLGIPLSYGGPYLGLFAARKEYVRKIAGRLVGETTDGNGKRGYVLTLTAREQHIRRDKATSNICTNQGLMALASTVYLSLLGKHGLRQVAELCYQKAHYAAEQINTIPGFSVLMDRPFFHEFVVKCPASVEEINLHLLDHEILGGYDLGKDYPSLQNHMMLAVTELNTREDIDFLCAVLKEYAND